MPFHVILRHACAFIRTINMHGCVMTQPFVAPTARPSRLFWSLSRNGDRKQNCCSVTIANETMRPLKEEWCFGVQGWLHCDSVVVVRCAMITATTPVTAF